SGVRLEGKGNRGVMLITKWLRHFCAPTILAKRTQIRNRSVLTGKRRALVNGQRSSLNSPRSTSGSTRRSDCWDEKAWFTPTGSSRPMTARYLSKIGDITIQRDALPKSHKLAPAR
ncbi:MAG: hypothetical protein WBX05_06695, partial [Pseudolabrys sp.]